MKPSRPTTWPSTASVLLVECGSQVYRQFTSHITDLEGADVRVLHPCIDGDCVLVVLVVRFSDKNSVDRKVVPPFGLKTSDGHEVILIVRLARYIKESVADVDIHGDGPRLALKL